MAAPFLCENFIHAVKIEAIYLDVASSGNLRYHFWGGTMPP